MAAGTTTTSTETSGAAARPVRVAIVDDHESVRLGIQAACQNEGFEVVLTAASVPEYVQHLDGREVDVVVLDLSLGDG